MKARFTIAALLLLLVNLFLHSQRASAGGNLDFLTPDFSGTVAIGDETFSEYISTEGGFRFGNGTIDGVYVSTNGYFAMGITPTANSQNIDSPNSVVAPYGADIDTRIAGIVLYTHVIDNGTDLLDVSDFIEDEINVMGSSFSFTGTRMIIAEWNGVAQYNGSESVTSTFQGILITDDITSYAVFIYECGGMGWGGATIGWEASSTHANVHSLNGEQSNDIGCMYSSNYSAVAFRLQSCDDNQFECDDVKCLSQDNVCDQREDCYDGRDEEEDCINIILYIAIGFGGVALLLICICLCICLGMACNYKKKQRRRRAVPQDDITPRDTPTTTTTAVNLEDTDEKPGAEPKAVASSNTDETSFTNSVLYPQLSVEDDLKGSSNGAPPSYNDFSTFPSVAGLQGYPPATYPQQSSLPTQQQQIPQPSEPLPPMITEDTV